MKLFLEGGSLKEKLPSLGEIRDKLMEDIDKLPEELKLLKKKDYRVIIK